MSSKGASRKCEFVHPETGERCRAWAMRGNDPPRCSAHRGDGGPLVGAPEGNDNRVVHGGYTPLEAESDLLGVIRALRRTLDRIEEAMESCSGEELRAWADLQGRISSRIGRLERDQKVLDRERTDQFWQLVGIALDKIEEERGVSP